MGVLFLFFYDKINLVNVWEDIFVYVYFYGKWLFFIIVVSNFNWLNNKFLFVYYYFVKNWFSWLYVLLKLKVVFVSVYI